ncbi:MAG: arginine--tRNA ligase [Nocardiopsis sp. BM-2018]|nr:MAG: arginine--tRNA ligase [Nocardiopsis sp. BM-2018]
MADPISTLDALLRPVFAELSGGDDVDPVVRPSDHADAQVNGSLPLAKRLGTNPRELAARLVERIEADGVLAEVCERIEIAGPGFVNLTLRDEYLAAELAVVAGDERLGVPAAASPRTAVVDYSAPNVAKEMHVGHLRSTVIGDALVRMLTFAGHTVVRENHIGDWGRPFGMLIEHLLDIGEDAAAEGMSQGDLDGFYKQANAKFDDDEAFQERSRQRVVLLQQGDGPTRELWERLVRMSTDYFNAVYTKLGVLLTDGDIVGESFYQPLMAATIERLDSAGLLTDSDGARVVFPDGFTNREGEPLPLIIQARTGGFNYATSDLTCVIDRVERLGADLLVYVVGAPQQQHLQMVFAVAELAGWLQPPAEAVHVAFGNVLGPDRKMLRSRSGDAVKLVELLDEAVERAAAAVAEKNPDLPIERRHEVARIVGIGAVKYADLSNDRIKDYVFDWDRMLSFDGNTAPYLQYAHARIHSIFRRADLDAAAAGGGAIQIVDPHERALAKALLAYPSVLADTLDAYAPHKLCTYLFDLSQRFTAFYEHCPVLRADDDTARSSRLALCALTARTLAHGLGLLGIDAPEQM